MTIRFQCPSCRQPLEIDQQWAGQSVACPYCKRVVAAPTSSTWEPASEVPTARPAAPGFAPPPPPAGTAPMVPGSSNRAGWALTLAIFAVLFMVLGIGIWMAMLTKMVQERVGTDATQQEMNKVLHEIMTEGKSPRSPIVGAAVVIATIFSIAALYLAVSALMQQERNRGKAVVACILSAALLFCQLGLILAAMAGRAPAS